MKRKLILTGLLLGTLALLVGLGVSTYRNASAAAPAAASVSTSTQLFNEIAVKGPGIDREAADQYLADALGITTEELSAARQTAYEAALTQSVEQELTTQAQADALKSGDLAFPIGGRWGEWLAQNGIDFDTFLADALGISIEKLQEARQTAQYARIDQAVVDGDLTEDQALLMKARYALANSQNFQDSMQSAFKAAIQQAVDDGLITQQQADLLLQKASQFDMRGLGGPEMLGGMPGGREPHGGGGFPGGPLSSDQSKNP
jgi:hypothetical protein